MVVAHEYGNWENKKFAILTPLETLEPQMLNVFLQDTFIVGNLKLSPGSILIAAKGQVIPEIPGIEVLSFDPATQNMREFIKATLESRGKWTFKSENGYLESAVLFNGKNVNGPEFFSNLMKEYPHLKFGLHSKYPLGELEWKLRGVFGEYKKLEYDFDKVVIDWKLDLLEIEALFHKQDLIMTSVKNPELLKTYHEFRVQLNANFNFVRAEIHLQETYGKTFLGTKGLRDSFKQQALALWTSLPELNQFLSKNLSLLKERETEISHDDLGSLYSAIGRLRREVSISEFSKILTKNPDIAELLGGMRYQESLKLFEEAMRNPKNTFLTKRAMERMTSELKTCTSSCWGYLHYMLRAPFSSQKSTLLSDPWIRANLGLKFDVDLLKNYEADDIGTLVWYAKELHGDAPAERQEKLDKYARGYGIVKISKEPTSP